jgi:hypothetical protein
LKFTQATRREPTRTSQGDDSPVKPQIHNATWPLHMLPATVDWRGTQADSVIKDQAMCGSCWAFSSVAPMETAYYREYGARWPKPFKIDFFTVHLPLCLPFVRGSRNRGTCTSSQVVAVVANGRNVMWNGFVCFVMLDGICGCLCIGRCNESHDALRSCPCFAIQFVSKEEKQSAASAVTT